MTLIETKKELYKQKPLANFLHCRKTPSGVVLLYGCTLGEQNGLPDTFFAVPVEELGDGLFGKTIEAQLLIRYIETEETFIQPKAVAKLEIVVKDPKEGSNMMDRLTVSLNGAVLYDVAAQLENMGTDPTACMYENKHLLMWIHGTVLWESEEQKAEYLAKHKYVDL